MYSVAVHLADFEKLWMLYNKIPNPQSKAVEDQARSKREVLRLKKEMSSTSSQDEFAKWAKLRRQHDKVLADYDKTSASLQTHKASFDSIVNVARWLSTNGLRFFLQTWYAKSAMFWIPQGWLPFYIEWTLAFLKAPRGSVSIQIWWIACASVIKLVSDASVAIYVLATERKVGSNKGEPQKFAAGGGVPPPKSNAGTPERKKEL
ncbi:MAG: GET complex subunit get1 [Pycnora praestabilis]|nr:MAG: GET complex subunit get1 [Pycnora praestabilis]